MGKNPQIMDRARFVDADVFVSLANNQDANHSWVVKISKILAKKEIPLVTSNYAFGEAITVISQKVGYKTALKSGMVIIKTIPIIDAGKDIRLRAFELFKKQTSKNTRFTDCINMILMKDLKIKEIFSYDSHYKKNGFLRIGIDIAMESI